MSPNRVNRIVDPGSDFSQNRVRIVIFFYMLIQIFI